MTLGGDPFREVSVDTALLNAPHLTMLSRAIASGNVPPDTYIQFRIVYIHIGEMTPRASFSRWRIPCKHASTYRPE